MGVSLPPIPTPEEPDSGSSSNGPASHGNGPMLPNKNTAPCGGGPPAGGAVTQPPVATTTMDPAMATFISTQICLMSLFLQKESTPAAAAVNPTVGRVTLLEHMPNSRNVHFCWVRVPAALGY